MPWEPSVLADELKREHTRAKRRRNRWGGKVDVTIIRATPPPPVVTSLTVAPTGMEAMQARVDEINATLKEGLVTETEREALVAERNLLVKQSERSETRTPSPPPPSSQVSVCRRSCPVVVSEGRASEPFAPQSPANASASQCLD